MKKLTFMFSALLLMAGSICMVGCGNDDPADSPSSGEKQEETQLISKNYSVYYFEMDSVAASSNKNAVAIQKAIMDSVRILAPDFTISGLSAYGIWTEDEKMKNEHLALTGYIKRLRNGNDFPTFTAPYYSRLSLRTISYSPNASELTEKFMSIIDDVKSSVDWNMHLANPRFVAGVKMIPQDAANVAGIDSIVLNSGFSIAGSQLYTGNVKSMVVYSGGVETKFYGLRKGANLFFVNDYKNCTESYGFLISDDGKTMRCMSKDDSDFTTNAPVLDILMP